MVKLSKRYLCILKTTTTINNDDNGKFIIKWGIDGKQNGGEFIKMHGIVLDSNNNVYVTEVGNSRIQKFDSDGNFVTMCGSKGSDVGEINKRKDIAIT